MISVFVVKYESNLLICTTTLIRIKNTDKKHGNRIMPNRNKKIHNGKPRFTAARKENRGAENGPFTQKKAEKRGSDVSSLMEYIFTIFFIALSSKFVYISICQL